MDKINTEQLPPLAKILQTRGILSWQQLHHHQQQAQRCQLQISQYLIEKNLVDSHTILMITSQLNSVPALDLAYLNSDCIPLDLVDEKLVHQYQFLPIYQQDNKLYLAMVDPTDQRVIKEMKFKTNLLICPVVVERFQLARLIKYILSKKNKISFDQLSNNLDLSSTVASNNNLNENLVTIYTDKEHEPLVSFINKVFLEAINQSASDIHFEPLEHNYRIRHRIDGRLYLLTSLSMEHAECITSRLKVLAQLDITEHRLPQDGSFKIKLNEDHVVDLRMSTCPTIYGEKTVVRILDPRKNQLNIEQLGMNTLQRDQFFQAIQAKHGMVIVTGPTGCGKTTTLYSAINFLNTEETNILTVEDPVEIKLAGIHQVHVNTKIGLDFAQVLRAFLRQDPDVIMIGEIRDNETAEIAIKAAQTGHLVLSTLHTNSAASTILRLQNLAISPYNITSSLSLIIAQQLARKLCKHCKQPASYSKSFLLDQGFSQEELTSLHLFKPGNCRYCFHGYSGRIGLFEIMPLSAEIKSLITSGISIETLETQAQQQGMITMRQSGLEQVKQGVISLEECNRLTSTIANNEVNNLGKFHV